MERRISGYSYQIAFNGEIYNLPDLKNDLLLQGWKFQTTSDTEVLLLAFLEYGPDFIKKVDGIFSFAIYDSRHETIYLFRDYFGIKPLFYTFAEDTLIFSSELKGLFCFPGIEAAVDSDGLNEIFSLGPARSPGNAVFKNIQELKPGYYLSYNRFGIHLTNFWRLSSMPHRDNYEMTIERTRFLLTDAIKRQMVSDVPICTFLSGGVDSSVVSAVCASELKKEGKPLTTYSFDFEDNDKYFQSNSFQPSQDAPYVKKMVEFLDSDHHYLFCDNEQQADLLYESVDAHDLPCMADIDSSLLYFCIQQDAARHSSPRNLQPCLCACTLAFSQTITNLFNLEFHTHISPSQTSAPPHEPQSEMKKHGLHLSLRGTAHSFILSVAKKPISA